MYFFSFLRTDDKALSMKSLTQFFSKRRVQMLKNQFRRMIRDARADSEGLLSGALCSMLSIVKGVGVVCYLLL